MREPVSRFYDVKTGEGGPYVEVYLSGLPMQRIPMLNKGTGFTMDERETLELEGLVPPHRFTLEEQKGRVYQHFLSEPSPLAKHVYLRGLQDRNEVLFYALLLDHLEEMLPIIYTPTVGEAVQKFSHIYRLPRGLTISTDNVAKADRALSHVPLNGVQLAVATDSSAILGLGDQGYGGMAIAIGKLSIYTAAGGIAPDRTLPIELDVGTDRDDHLRDPLYLGVRHRRLTGDAYLAFMDRFVETLIARYPGVVLQWEDLGKDTAFTVLGRYRRVLPSFNDDIQGTGAVTLAGILSACRALGSDIAGQRFLILGAGAGGIGVARAIHAGLMRAGLGAEAAHRQIFVLDSKGLLVEGRAMDAFKRPFAQPAEAIDGWQIAGAAPNLIETVRHAEPTALIGLSGQRGAFSREVIETAASACERPIVFALSNPSDSSEAAPEDVVAWSEGRAIIATGSPFADVEVSGRVHRIGQGNNAFIFPGLGLGTVLSRASEVTDDMVLAAAYALAGATDVTGGRVYPAIADLRPVSVKVAAAVMAQARRDGVARSAVLEGLDDAGLEALAEANCWEPRYLPFVPARPPSAAAWAE